MKVILNVSNLKVNYGQVAAVKDISISVKQGQIVSIIGSNGAGKSSTLNAISGIYAPSFGEIIFCGKNITGMSSDIIVKRGINQVPEGRHLFTNLSVRENLLSGKHSMDGIILKKTIPEQILIKFPTLLNLLDSNSSILSGGQAQLLALARGLMNNPRLLLLDEPTLGLAPIMVKEIFNLICELKNNGLTILLVEQNVNQTLEISDFAYVLESGRIVKKGIGTKLLKDSKLIDSYLGFKKK